MEPTLGVGVRRGVRRGRKRPIAVPTRLSGGEPVALGRELPRPRRPSGPDRPRRRCGAAGRPSSRPGLPPRSACGSATPTRPVRAVRVVRGRDSTHRVDRARRGAGEVLGQAQRAVGHVGPGRGMVGGTSPRARPSRVGCTRSRCGRSPARTGRSPQSGLRCSKEKCTWFDSTGRSSTSSAAGPTACAEVAHADVADDPVVEQRGACRPSATRSGRPGSASGAGTGRSTSTPRRMRR